MTRVAAGGDTRTYVPDDAQGALIADVARVLEEARPAAVGPRPALVAANGQRYELPEPMFAVLRQVAEALSSGMGVSVAPLSAMLTTQEAADYLGVSRPTLVRILERGEIPMHKPGRHRFVRLQDLLAYQQRMQVERRAALDQMVTDAVRDDLYARTDGPPPRTR